MGQFIIQSTDTDNVPLSRTKITKSGWHYQLHGLDFVTSKLDSIYNKDYLGNDLGFASISFFDSNNNQLTGNNQAELDSSCVKTEIVWEPHHDIDIIGGILEQVGQPDSDVRIWVIAVPGYPAEYGGSVMFAQGGVNLKYLSKALDLDGKTPKTMLYNSPAPGTNAFKIVVKHPAGYQWPIQMLFKFFKENN